MNFQNLGKIKIILIVIAVVLIVPISISVATSNLHKDNGQADAVNNNGTAQTTNTTTTTETTTVEKRLSDDCTYILATGYDNGNYYELVANQIDGYPQSSIKMGVIKNNEWLIPLSYNFPFLKNNWFNDVGRPLRDEKDPHKEYESDSYHFHYVGEGTFYYYYQEKYIAYQANQTIYKPETGHSFMLCNFFIEERDDFLNNGEFLANDAEKGFCYYNLNTGEMRTVGGVFGKNNTPSRNHLFGIHDGLFYASKDKDAYGDKYNGFFDLNGNTIIDLSEYNISDYHDCRFRNGKYTITCRNDNGVLYDITFDNTGKIISQEKAS